MNEYELTSDNDLMADAVKDLVLGIINENDFADVLYAQYFQENSSILSPKQKPLVSNDGGNPNLNRGFY